MIFRYKSESVIAFAGWFCCLTGFLIFGGILLSFANFDDPWVEDSCLVVARDDSCLENANDCEVSVTVLVSSDPICEMFCAGHPCESWEMATTKVCTKRVFTIYSLEEDDAAVWLKMYALNTTHTCYLRDDRATFAAPPSLFSQENLGAAGGASVVFIAAALVLIPAFVRGPASAQGRMVAAMGIQRVSSQGPGRDAADDNMEIGL
eukprot:CAMPEP_0113685254 /NCGR_PEP_ID=MMETSP0038_2-20120614/14549_1 /TAXON_ID=2898 /ORGANISM="Cryptomonas paramecium" /LENGTH=205 /DNA_ID=CAMNT_0000605279 /DNA_START=32 /DNA_END=646 /DNA_ORIENTATION=- /assembly_acc=CAM_ASM_000170